MKIRYVLKLLVLSALLAGEAIAQTPITQAMHSPENILVNPGFENGKYGYTASGGTFSVSAAAKLRGSYGATWDSGSAAQTLISSAITIPAGLQGKNGLAYCAIKTVSGTATHTIVVDDGTNPLVTAQTITSSTSSSPRSALNFIFPSSGSVRLKLASVAADEPEIYIDGCYIGEASNVKDVGIATSDEAFTPALVGFGTPTLLDFVWSRLGDKMYIRGRFASGTPSATEARVPLPNSLTVRGSGIQHVGMWARDAASNVYRPMIATGGNAYINFTSAAVGLAAQNGNSVSGGAAEVLTVFAIVPITGWTAETAYRPEQLNWRVDANISGANPSLGTADVSSYTEIINGSLTLTNNTGNGVIAAQVPCSTTNAPSGTTCSAGSESVGVSFTLPVAGDVRACAHFTHQITNTNDDVSEVTFQLVETPTNAQTISQEGKSRISSGWGMGAYQNTAPGVTHPFQVCGTFTFASAGQKVLRLMYEQDITSVPTSNVIVGDADAAVGQPDIHWEVYPINQAVPAPVLVGSVTSGTSGSERIERAELNCDASSAITSQSGSWLSAIGNRSTAACAITIASGIFSLTPSCTFTVKATTVQATAVNMTSATAGTVYGASADYDGYLHCMGSR